MLTIADINNIECNEDATEAEYFTSLQRAINSHSWNLQGSYGRAMMQAIEGGYCMLGKTPCRDYWQNRIPSRDEVQEGTKGSYQYVVDHMGQDWADAMAAL